MYKIKFEVVPGLDGFLIHDGKDTFTLEQAKMLLKQSESQPYAHIIVEAAA
jgi:hypothetical protein